MNEFERGENSPQRVLSERVASTAYLWHNYEKSTIGSREDLEKVPAERLAAFYKKYYQPDNAAFRKYMDPAGVTIVKAGDFKKVAVYQ